MTQSLASCWSRRRVLPAAVAGLLVCCACSKPPTSPSQTTTLPPQKTQGIIELTKGPRDFVRPPDTPAGKTWLYQIVMPFQVSATKAGALCNVREGLAKGVDFECGVDVILFDGLSNMNAAQAVSVTRNEEEPNPHSLPPGKPSIIVKYPARTGFVPLGARLADGTAHPSAGTGFAINQAIAWTKDDPGAPPYGVNMFTGPEAYWYFEVHQFAYDGKTFKVTATERVPLAQLIQGWTIQDGGLTNAIPDGNDLLVGMTGGKIEGTRLKQANPSVANLAGAGVMRWHHDGKAWRPISFVPVTGTDGSFEPSLIRDTDGKLLFSARGSREPDYNDIRVWRSEDNGATWSKVVHARGAISSSTISLNQAADGTPYIAANLYQVFMSALDRIKLPKDSEGRTRLGGATRNTLCLWPLNAERNALEPPLVGRDLAAEFGPPPGGSAWRVDHPSGMTVRLADGKWHHLLGMRVLEYGELTYMMPPTPKTGSYIEELISAGEPRPIWKF